ncbi:hypothetical protein RvY_08336 [Ramazzottius varieornatus]|uniref:Uncharacterized protein n=1 Tax=Ramazzottius varieornatus TaxID=947166 RepID=A0A1D1VDM0_RAMVA|nr:hypothetical protein RvY_08336 [Ramazzottius varieornatus]
MDKSMSIQYSNFILTSGLDVVSLTTHFIVALRTYQWTTCFLVLDAGDTTKSTGGGSGLATVVAGVHAMGQAIGGNVLLRFINSSQSQEEFGHSTRLLLKEVQSTARGM